MVIGMKKITALFLCFLLVISFAACGTVRDHTKSSNSSSPDSAAGTPIREESGSYHMESYDFSKFSNVKITETKLPALNDEQLSVLFQQARYCQAMTDADIETMRKIVSEDTTFTHMNGLRQSREEYFADVNNGYLRYFTIGIENPSVKVNGNVASISYTAVLNADAYGARGTYRMSGTHWYEKRNGNWIAVNEPHK